MSKKTKEAMDVVGRLAPSPTGAQHVGNARTYLLAWLSARLQRGKLLLRIEDIDSPRIKAGASEQALDDLRWLGLDWDECSSASNDLPESQEFSASDESQTGSEWVQTQRLSIYHSYLEQLRRAGRLYPCNCTRRDIELASSAPHIEDHVLRYPGTCRQQTLPDILFPHAERVDQVAEGLAERPFAWRFRCSDAMGQFADGVRGDVSAWTEQQFGDFVIARSQGSIAYQLAVVVDDHLMGVTEVVRGDDLIPSTYWQLELYHCLGWKPPQFYHVPLVVGPDGRRLAKRHGDTRLSEIRNCGTGPERLLGVLAKSCNLIDTDDPLTATQLLEHLEENLQSRAAEPTVISAGGRECESQNSVNLSARLWNRLPQIPFVLTNPIWRYVCGRIP